MTDNGRNKRRSLPESKFYSRLRGQQVKIVNSRDGSEVHATLLWIDRYSLGLRVGDREVLINKRSIESIERSSPTRERQNEPRDYRGAAL